MQWVALPGDGLIREPAVIPAGQAGTHRLDFDHEKGHAELPIRLE
jgi:hypothetical protein